MMLFFLWSFCRLQGPVSSCIHTVGTGWETGMWERQSLALFPNNFSNYTNVIKTYIIKILTRYFTYGAVKTFFWCQNVIGGKKVWVLWFVNLICRQLFFKFIFFKRCWNMYFHKDHRWETLHKLLLQVGNFPCLRIMQKIFSPLYLFALFLPLATRQSTF